jgi:hypothetical protein
MLALRARGPADGLHALDAERLDDGMDGHDSSQLDCSARGRCAREVTPSQNQVFRLYSR